MRTASVFVAVFAMLIAFGSAGGAGDKDKAEAVAKKIALAKKVLGQAKIEFTAALKTAQEKIPQGKALVARVELNKADKGRYGFYFLKDGKVQEVEIDVVSGDVVKFEEKKDFAKIKKFAEAQKAVDGAKVSFTEAIEIAAKKVKDGRLFEVEMEMDGDKGVVEVEFLVADKITKVRIDAKDATAVKVLN
jgi:uncharacterized membrane protein YkoI